MNKELTLTSEDFADVALRSIVATDQDSLRRWKNAHRFAFFYQDIITPEQQTQWFEGYWERPHDFMFIVLAEDAAVGCLGFRMLDSAADVYNVILGVPEMGGRGLMRKAMRLMCSYVLRDFTRDIGVKVLRANPAIEWYNKIGFQETQAHETYVEMRLDLARFQPCRFRITNREQK